MSNTLESNLIKKATDIVLSIKNFEVSVNRSGSINRHIEILYNKMYIFDMAESDSTFITEEDAKEIIYSYNVLLTKGIITENPESSKKIKELEENLVKATKERDQLEGRLSEYRRMYGTNDTFTGEVTSE